MRHSINIVTIQPKDFPGGIRDYIKVKMPDNLITALLDVKPRLFKSGATLYGPDEWKNVDVGNVEVQIKRDPTGDNNYLLHLGGKKSVPMVT